MDERLIRSRLKARGFNFTRIASVLEVSPSLVSMVAGRKRQNARVAKAIATALELPTSTVFPDVPEYHGPILSKEEREQALSAKLQQIGAIRRSA